MHPLIHGISDPSIAFAEPAALSFSSALPVLPSNTAAPAAPAAAPGPEHAQPPATEPPPPVEPPLPSVSSVIRISVGRGPHTDLAGRTWARDEAFLGGNVSVARFEVLNTFEDPLYYTRRWGDFDYRLPVPSGTYDVRLHFAEPIHIQPGKRKFNVFAEGNLVLNRFDVAGSGGGQAVLVRSVIVSVADNTLDLRFRGVVDHAILSALEVRPLNPDGWTAVTAAPNATSESHAAAVNGKLYLFGGYDATMRALRAANVYDVDADTWTRLADMPRPIVGAATAGAGETIWFAGGLAHDSAGKPPSADVWRYDVAQNTWTPGPPLPKAVAAAAMVRLGRKLRVFGGVDSTGADSANHWVLDLDQIDSGWQTSAPLPAPRHHLAGVAVGGKIYAIGGQQGSDELTGNVADVYAYDWETNAWTAVASLPAPRSHIAGSTFAVSGNRIVLVGGITNRADGDNARADVLEFDTATNTWSHRDWLPGVRNAPVARFLANRLVVTTGSIGPGSPRTTTWTRLL